jgi:hypothetical protein
MDEPMSPDTMRNSPEVTPGEVIKTIPIMPREEVRRSLNQINNKLQFILAVDIAVKCTDLFKLSDAGERVDPAEVELLISRTDSLIRSINLSSEVARLDKKCRGGKP